MKDKRDRIYSSCCSVGLAEVVLGSVSSSGFNGGNESSVNWGLCLSSEALTKGSRVSSSLALGRNFLARTLTKLLALLSLTAPMG